jgi:ribosome-associated protein
MKRSTEPASALSSKEKALTLLRAAIDNKASRPVLIRLVGLTPLADYFLIVTARSRRHVTAVAEHIMERARGQHIERLSSEGITQGNWALLDYGDVIVHVFQTQVRAFYDLEGLWSEAPRETLPEDLAREVALAAEAEAEEEEEDLSEYYEGPIW